MRGHSDSRTPSAWHRGSDLVHRGRNTCLKSHLTLRGSGITEHHGSGDGWRLVIDVGASLLISKVVSWVSALYVPGLENPGTTATGGMNSWRPRAEALVQQRFPRYIIRPDQISASAAKPVDILTSQSQPEGSPLQVKPRASLSRWTTQDP